MTLADAGSTADVVVQTRLAAGRERRVRPARLVRGLVGVSAVVVGLELVTRVGLVDTASLPSPLAILWRAVRLVGSASFLIEVLRTLRVALLGLALASLVGVALGGLMGTIPRLARSLAVPIELLRPLPAIAIAPLLVLVYGRGVPAGVLAVAYATVWPILFNTLHGIRSVDPVGRQAAASFGLGRWAVLWRVSMPSAVPFAFTGIRIASAIALLVTVSVEVLLGDGTGIGGFILQAGTSGAPLEVVYGGAVASGLVGLTVNLGLAGLERRLFPWRLGLGR